jgi:hypothetical protein
MVPGSFNRRYHPNQKTFVDMPWHLQETFSSSLEDALETELSTDLSYATM